MASSACQKIHPLSQYIIPDRPHNHHPCHSCLLPFPASPSTSPQDSLPSTSYPQSFFIFPSTSMMTNVPFVRSVFDTMAHVSPLMDQELESAENSGQSSNSSCFMSSHSDDDEDDTGSSSTSSSSQLTSPRLGAAAVLEGPLDNLTSLCAALPIKRGLSRYFSGKSQSFSSLARVSSVADLAKPENPFVKRRKMVDSHLKHHSYPPRCGSSAGISKRSTTSSRYKSLKCLPRPDGTSLEGHEKSRKPWPAKCFSVPEF